MKTLNFYYAAIAAFIFFGTSCSKAVEDLLTYNAPEVKTAFVVQIYDAKTKLLVGQNSDHEIRVIIKGRDKSLIKDIFGRSVSSITTNNGIISLTVSKTITPSNDQPVEFLLQLESNGYATGSLPVIIASPGGHSFIARLVNFLMPPEGVAIFEGIIGTSQPDGTVVENMEATTPPEPLTGATTKIAISEGTLIKNENGEPLSGQLTSRIVYYCNQYPDVLDCFPGSFCVKTLEDGVAGHNLFFSGGWASYEITDQNGKTAKTFNPPVQITMDVPPLTYNPETQSIIKSGDYYPIWDYNFNDGTWVLENEGLLEGPDSRGNFFINFPSNHFSSKNTDKKKCPPPQPTNNCTQPKNLKATIDERNLLIKELSQKSNNSEVEISEYLVPQNIRLVYKEQSTGFIYWSSGYINGNNQNNTIYIPDVPCELPTNIEVWGGCPYARLGNKLINDLCSEDPITIPLNDPNPPTGTRIEVDFAVRVNCSFAHLRPNIPAFVDYGCGWKFIGLIENGKITVPGLEMGQGYSFGIWIENQWFDEFFIVNQEQFEWDVELPDNICEAYR